MLGNLNILTHFGVGGAFFEVAEPRSAEHGSYTHSYFYVRTVKRRKSWRWSMKIESIEFDKSLYLTSATKTIVPFFDHLSLQKVFFPAFHDWPILLPAFPGWPPAPSRFPSLGNLLNVATPYFVFLLFPQILHVHTVTCFDMAVSDWAFDSQSVSSVQSDTSFAFATTS